jgi:hypothetical protein
MRIAYIAILFCTACSSSEPAAPQKPDWSTADCATQAADADKFACAEAQFWRAFQQPGLELRAANEKTLAAVIAATESSADKSGRGLMHFRLGQLRLAMALENDQRDYALKSKTMIVGEFDAAMALDAYNGIVAPWKDAMEIATAAILSDWTRWATRSP